MPKKVSHPYVEQRKSVCGGRPVIKGTRFPVSSIAIHYQRGLTAEDILQDFPQLTVAQVYGALAYYFDHQEEIGEEIEQTKTVERQMNKDLEYRLSLRDEARTLPGS